MACSSSRLRTCASAARSSGPDSGSAASPRVAVTHTDPVPQVA